MEKKSTHICSVFVCAAYLFVQCICLCSVFVCAVFLFVQCFCLCSVFICAVYLFVQILESKSTGFYILRRKDICCVDIFDGVWCIKTYAAYVLVGKQYL